MFSYVVQVTIHHLWICGEKNDFTHHRPIHTSTREEAGRDKIFDLVRWIRVRRLRKLGHSLRIHPDRMIHKVVRYLLSPGDILSHDHGKNCVQ